MVAVSLKLDRDDKPIVFLMDDCEGLDHVVGLARQRGLAHYEAPYPVLAAGLVQALSGDVLDVGANTGLYSFLAAASRPGVSVHSFEPLPTIYDRLQHNIGLNAEIGSSITAHQIALSNTIGEAVFFETINPHGLLSTSSGLDAVFARQHGNIQEHLLPTTTLDAWIAAHGIAEISFIKIDVEGHEQAVLSGASDAVQLLRPVIGVELLSGANFDFFHGFLLEHDFLDCALSPTAIMIGNRPQFVGDGWNHLLVPTERLPVVAHVAIQAGLAVHEALV